MNTVIKQYHMDDLSYDSVRKIAEEAGLKTYDTALPMNETDAIFDTLGVSIWGHGAVYCYDDPTPWGQMYPLTYEANLILWIYSQVVGIKYTYVVDPKDM